jgi:hypothetical protein
MLFHVQVQSLPHLQDRIPWHPFVHRDLQNNPHSNPYITYENDQPRGLVVRVCLLIMKSRVRFPALPWGFFLEGEYSHGDHGLGSLVELRLRPLLVLHIHVSPSTSTGQRNWASWASHEVHKGHVVALEKKNENSMRTFQSPCI